MRELAMVVGLAALTLTIAARLDPPQQAVLVDTSVPAPIDHFNRGEE
jgi:hypothetical protein